MTRLAELLKILRERGEKGVSSKEIAKRFGYKKADSTSKSFYLLKKDGLNVVFDRERRVYVLKDGKPTIASHNSGPGYTTPKRNSNKKPSGAYRDAKKYHMLQELSNAGSEGMTTEALAKAAGIETKNVCFHIFSLRHKDKHKIENYNGRYFLKSKVSLESVTKKNPQGVMPEAAANLSEETSTGELQALSNAVNDKRLIQGLTIILKEDIDSYLDMLKKIAFYRKCALSLIEATEMTLSVSKTL